MPDGYSYTGPQHYGISAMEAQWYAERVMALHLRHDHGYSLVKIQQRLGRTRKEVKRMLGEDG